MRRRGEGGQEREAGSLHLVAWLYVCPPHIHTALLYTPCYLQMGLHVFFGCYFNLFRLMAKCGVLENLLLKVCGPLLPHAGYVMMSWREAS